MSFVLFHDTPRKDEPDRLARCCQRAKHTAKPVAVQAEVSTGVGAAPPRPHRHASARRIRDRIQSNRDQSYETGTAHTTRKPKLK